MGTVFLWIVIGTSVWMAFDAHQIGYDKKDVKGMAGMGPLGWLFAGLLLWIVAFPLYLASRNKLKAAASAGSSTPTGGMGQMAGAPSSEGTERIGEGSKAGMSPMRQKLNMAAGIFCGGWVVLALAWNLIGSEPAQSPEASSSQPAQTQGRAAQAEVSQQEAASATASDRVCRSRGFPSCDAARTVYFQWRNQLGLHSFEERCSHANATRFLDDRCGGPGDFRVR